jgi:DNA-binding transcriptional LysR family regulator
MMLMNWDDMRIFLSVARAGTLSGAARELRITQPTVGRRLKGLEEALGTRLFDRLPEGFAPTPAGEELLPLAEAMEVSALTVNRRQPALMESARGTVRISVWENLAKLLTDHIADLRRNLPEIEIEISVTHIHANLVRREADLLIRECLPDNPGLIARRLGSYTFAVYGGQRYVSAHPAALGEARYRACEWVGFDEDHTYFHNQSWLLERLSGRAPAVRVNNGMIIHEAVRKGAGLGVLPCFAGDDDEALVRLSAPVEELERNLYLVVHKDLRRSPSVRAVIDALARVFKLEAARLLGRDPQALRCAVAGRPADASGAGAIVA